MAKCQKTYFVVGPPPTTDVLWKKNVIFFANWSTGLRTRPKFCTKVYLLNNTSNQHSGGLIYVKHLDLVRGQVTDQKYVRDSRRIAVRDSHVIAKTSTNRALSLLCEIATCQDLWSWPAVHLSASLHSMYNALHTITPTGMFTRNCKGLNSVWTHKSSYVNLPIT